MTTFDFSNNAAAAAWYATHGAAPPRTSRERYTCNYFNKSTASVSALYVCYLDDIIKSNAAAAFLNPRPDSLAARIVQRRSHLFGWLPTLKKHKYLAKIKEEKLCSAFTIVF
jgi:hypothetical protein